LSASVPGKRLATRYEKTARNYLAVVHIACIMECSSNTREKRLKKWRRAWKIRLIEEKNPRWDDLWQQILI